MQDPKFYIGKSFQLAFGINLPIFITEPLWRDAPYQPDYTGLTFIEDYDKAEATSWMGTPIIGLLKFKGGTYQQYNSSGVVEDVDVIEYTLPPATLFSFRRAKNITETNLLGSNGTVKEIFGFDDWVIDVKGLAVNTPENSARYQLDTLRDWEELACSINISGKLFTQKKIHAVTMFDYKEESIQGSPDIIPFSMTLKSDEVIELILPDFNENF